MNTLISKLLGTAVGVKIGNDTIIGLLVGMAWDENLQISELSLSPSENNILSILIETPIPCTDIPKLERKEDSGNKTNLVRMSMFIPEETNTSAKLDIIKILKKQFNFSLSQTKEYVDSCIGKYSTLPNTILQTEVDEVTKKLEPYNVNVSTAVFY